ncbi:Uncharacterised protein [Pseudomonas putida]|nr:Uncharacterised protein [Pseudomonas putida]CAB5677709.1 Uncharacterised protein [Pseudomonas putida]CAB5685446.1 Uncharacterised protein [Pseudomonas putida]CAB5705597.1 Uncharacterised protein [Pseudomonas putida]CAC9680570.1 Uncharacterised protein [Pseudomonas putida]
MPVEIIVRPTLGSYTARAKGHKATASRSEGQLQAAAALLRKLELTDGELQQQDSSHLPQGHQLFHFHTSDEISSTMTGRDLRIMSMAAATPKTSISPRLEHSREVDHV